jgi:hypothetical protein
MNEQQLEIAKQIVSAISSDYYLEQASKMFIKPFVFSRNNIVDYQYICNVSSSFQVLWEINKEDIQELAEMYIRERNENKYFVSNEVLFVESYDYESAYQERLMGTSVRYNFLKWLEEKLI